MRFPRPDEGHDYYFRQLREMKMTMNLEGMPKQDWIEYIELCGQALARAHARTGDAAQIAGYLGKSDTFDQAIAKFAVAYADQTESDHAVFVKAIRTRRLPPRTDRLGRKGRGSGRAKRAGQPVRKAS